MTKTLSNEESLSEQHRSAEASPGGMGPRQVPLVTIVTPTVDASGYIDEAIASVPSQKSDQIEHIVVHDGSQAFVSRLAGKYPWLRFVPGEGRGATAAVAVGTAAASGKFIIMLSSDDRLVSGAIKALETAVAARPEIEVWTGGTRIFAHRADGQERSVRIVDHPSMTALTLKNVLDDLPLMTARFVHRAVFERIGSLDVSFSACSDREFALRMALSSVREASLGVCVSELRIHEGSATLRKPGRFVPRYLDEHVEIAWRGITDRDVAFEARATLRYWHARETLRKAYYELRAGEITKLGITLRTAFGRDSIWPWRAISAVAAFRRRRRSGHLVSPSGGLL